VTKFDQNLFYQTLINMKSFQFSPLLFIALLWSGFLAAKPTVCEKTIFSVPVGTDRGCPAPAPASLVATDVTPTSISLEWTPIVAPSLVYFKVESYDLTAGAALPSYIITTNSFTYTGLTAGHTYQFGVSASYCSNGPFGGVTESEVRIPTIIIDNIVQLQSPCTLGNPLSTGQNRAYNFCVQESGSPEPYTNGFVGAITFNNQALQFAVVNYGGDIIIGELTTDNPNFSFEKNGDSEAICYYDVSGVPTTPLFTVSHVNGTPVLPALRIKFLTNCGTFSSCGSPCGVASERSDGGFVEAENPSEIFVNPPAPNPFTESTILRYQLEKEASVEVALYDATGRLIHFIVKESLQGKGQYEVMIEGASLPDGAYFLHTQIDGQSKVFSLVKSK